MDSEDSNRQDSKLVDLELQHLYKRFGNLEVVSDLSLTVYKGELCCLLGPSGCGKTTALKIIDGLLEPDKGTVRLAGQDITRMPPQQRNLGMVFQNYALFPHMNVYDNVAYGLRRRRWTEAKIKAKVVEALHLVQLSDYEERRIHELSGGQQQRIALARSLVIEPKLLLLDEPLSNLDARLRANMRDEIRHIQRTLNITTIYVTHDQEEAMSIADRIAVMNRRLVEQIGPPREIYEQPATQFVADFIGRINFIHGRIVEGSLLLLGKRFPILSKEWPEGTEVICAIRPERLRIQQASSSLVNAIVQDATYFGAVVRYHVVLKSGDSEGTELNVEASYPWAAYEPGEQVGISLRFEDLHLFRYSDEPDSD